NAFIKSEVNPRLRLGRHFSIIPVYIDEGYPVYGSDGETVLFNVLHDVRLYNAKSAMFLRWFSIWWAVLGIFCFLWGFPKGKSLWIALPLLGLLRLFCFLLERQLSELSPLFSTMLYSDPSLSETLANLLFNHLFIFFAISAVVIVRRSFVRFFIRLREAPRSGLQYVRHAASLALLPLLLAVHIHVCLRSIAIHANMGMEIFRVGELSIYSVLVYFSFGLLFTALYFLICLGWPIWVKKGYRNILLSQRMIALYVGGIALYSLVMVAVYGSQRELERNRDWTVKMGMERDAETEKLLLQAEGVIDADVILKSMIEYDVDDNLILSRLMNVHFAGLQGRYDLQITLCRPGDNLLIETQPIPVNCYNFFHLEIARYGTLLEENSAFYFLDNANGRTSYIGVIHFRFYGGYRDLYIELDSRLVKEMIGYPELLRDQTDPEWSRVPYNYSFAKYMLGDLNTFSGSYMYSTQLPTQYPTGSFTVMEKDGYRHYINSFNTHAVIILSRPVYTFFSYLVSFSYLALFYGLIIFGIIKLPVSKFWKRNPNRSFRRRIMLLVVVSLIGALIFMGSGSVWFGIKLYNENNRRAMEEKMQIAQSMLEYSFRLVDRWESVNIELLSQQLTQLSKNMHIDINIYDQRGWLVQTSQPEIFDKYLMGSCMNSTAFRMMDRMHRLKFFHKEHIGGLQYYSVYAPFFNDKGKRMGYLNLPYFSRESKIAGDLTSVVATVANIYILLLLAAILAGTALSNQLGRPLVEVGKKMQRLDLTRQLEHINYKGKDELGELIHTYNKMVDDLAEASGRIAQTEREQAWREMARQIAHEIKNPLTPMRLSLQHLIRLKKEKVPDWSERFDGLAQTLIEHIDILSDAASELSSFSRFYSEETAPVELNHLIEEQRVLFSTGETVKILFTSEVNPAYVMGRKQQLSRVLVNLISNARQALEGRAGGRVRLRLEQTEEMYALHVEDDGPGVPKDLRNRLFKPNFTTKSSGTGLGLAICRSIIEQTQGTISYGSSEWGGACFTILLPISAV
ncbi:MAG: ATP-binding protein, partial [Bacteroidales bacterium]|nr:ATP-binding protein [Bacteroidales bacterium]